MINNKIIFIFSGELNDFLPQKNKYIHFTYLFKGKPSVKDAIEASGIPHTEVDLIFANKISVDFSYIIKNKDVVEVHPLSVLKEGNHLLPAIENYRFISDVHLGKLTKYLRMIGFDTVYENNLSDEQIITKSIDENRIILTRDLGILKNKKVKLGYWIRNQDPRLQIAEVIDHFSLKNLFNPFQRCINCNAKLNQTDKKFIKHKIEPLTEKYYDVFFKCDNCNNIYWKGSHYEKMKYFIENLKIN